MQIISHSINRQQHVSEVQISQVLIIFSLISHHEGIFIQPEGLVYIYCLFCFVFFVFLQLLHGVKHSQKLARSQ